MGMVGLIGNLSDWSIHTWRPLEKRPFEPCLSI